MSSPQMNEFFENDGYLTPPRRVTGKKLRWPSAVKSLKKKTPTQILILNNIDEDFSGFFNRKPLFPPKEPVDLVPDLPDPEEKPQLNPNLFRLTPTKVYYEPPNPEVFHHISNKIQSSISEALQIISDYKNSPRKEDVIVPNDRIGGSIYGTTNNMSHAVQNLGQVSRTLNVLAHSISKLSKSYKRNPRMSISELS
mmetsp:Transcript_2937/g.2654  ORF Transcript_2937/g.2654 Transcript_2937/m.2654 type:complete len:196 (+) Transcript_2937:25-612(+)